MKTFSLVVKFIIIPCSSLIGIIYGFDMYIVKRANTAIEPTKIKVESVEKNIAEITIRTRNIESILMERK